MLPPQASALAGREVIFHDDAVDVVCFVLQAPGQSAGALDGDCFAELVLAAADGEVGAGDFPVGAGERQAAFVVVVLGGLGGQGDLGVADQALVKSAVRVEAVVDEDGSRSQ